MRNGWSYHAPRRLDWIDARYSGAVFAAEINGGGTKPDRSAAFKSLEERTGARLGVSAHDTGADNRIGYREDERFAMCSTFKFLASAAVLARVDRKEEKLDRMILVKKSDILPNSPAAEKNAGKSMSLEALCEAAIILSDNTAGNLYPR